MSSNADQVTAKLAALAKLRQQKEEQRRQMEAEAEANRLEEERLEQELERMRLAEEERQKREAAAAAEEAKRRAEQAARDLVEFKRRERESLEAIDQKKRELRAKKEKEEAERRAETERKKAEAAKRTELEKGTETADKGKKRSREESVEVTVGAMLEEDGVVWHLKEGRICKWCAKAGEKCFWREVQWATACQRCHMLKKTCAAAEVMTEVTEAGPLKKRKVAPPKGKGKEKEKMETEMGEETGAALLAEMRGMRTEMVGVRESIEGLCAEFQTLANVSRMIVKLLQNTDENVGFIADQMDGSEAGDGVGGMENGVGEERTAGDQERANPHFDEGREGRVQVAIAAGPHDTYFPLERARGHLHLLQQNVCTRLKFRVEQHADRCDLWNKLI